ASRHLHGALVVRALPRRDLRRVARSTCRAGGIPVCAEHGDQRSETSQHATTKPHPGPRNTPARCAGPRASSLRSPFQEARCEPVAPRCSSPARSGAILRPRAFLARAGAGAERRVKYHRADASRLADVAGVLDQVPEPVVVYLALPPSVVEGSVRAVASLREAEGSSLVVEKPFGENLASAQTLNRLLAATFPETAVFHMDHFLGTQTVQNVLGLPLREPRLRAAVEPRPRGAGGDHLGRDPDARGPGVLLRLGRGAPGHDPEPSPAVALPDRHGSAHQSERARLSRPQGRRPPRGPAALPRRGGAPDGSCPLRPGPHR
ncbi:MAG: glucose-6-phosphate 1-dehydrogenase, partial [Candidatus Binatota bacterium]|nr:glucose-6-phosphate 1-dehydrogenase [Candidatus Binatota bacterium]